MKTGSASSGWLGILSLPFILCAALYAYTGQFLWMLLPFISLLLIASWNYPHLAFFLLIASLPFSFEYNFLGDLATDIPDEGLMLLVSFIFLAKWIYSPAEDHKLLWKHPLVLLLVLHLLWIVITCLSSTFPIMSLKHLLAKGWYMGAFVAAPLLLFSDKRMIRIAIKVLFLSTLLVVLVILVRHANDNFIFAEVNNSVIPFFRNHVNYSSLLVAGLPLFCLLLTMTSRKFLRLLIVLAILILLLGLFFSYARGAWLALLTGAVSCLLIKKKWLVSTFLIALTLAIAALFWLKSNDRYLEYAHDYKTTIFHEDFKEHLIATYKLKDVSTAERFYRWIAGVRMIKDHWMTGTGPSTFYQNYKPYTVPAFKTWVSDNRERSTIHNYFLLLLVEQGIPGVLLFIFLIVGMLYFAQRLYHRVEDPFYQSLCMAIAATTVVIITINLLSDMIETDKIGPIFFLCLALLVRIDINTRRKKLL